ncbi:MAG: type II secretion system F family protein [Alphaproteobacteria bacterium]
MPDLGGTDVIFIAVFVGALVVFGAVALAWATGGSKALDRRIDKVTGRFKVQRRVPLAVSVRRKGYDLPDASRKRLLSRMMPARSKIAVRLAKAGKSASPEAFGLICLGVGLFAALAFIVLLKMSLPFALLAGAAAGVLLPWFVLGRMASKRTTKFLEAFPDAIDLLVRSVRVGLPIAEAISIGGRDLPDPVGTEFGRMSNSIRLGRTFEEAMWEVADRLDIAEFNFFATSLAVQRETGGNIAETLSNLSSLIRSRHQMKKKVRALSSEARASAWIVGSLPFAMFLILLLINRDYVMALLNEDRGLMLLGVGLGSQAIGVAIMAKLTRFEI